MIHSKAHQAQYHHPHITRVMKIDFDRLHNIGVITSIGSTMNPIAKWKFKMCNLFFSCKFQRNNEDLSASVGSYKCTTKNDR